MHGSAHTLTVDVADGRVHATVRRGAAEHAAHATADATADVSAGVSPDATADLAADLTARLVALAGASPDTARLAVLDLREAPLIADPDTVLAVVAVLAAWEAAARKIALVVGDEAIRAAQYRAVAARHAPKFARVVIEPSEALAWCEDPVG